MVGPLGYADHLYADHEYFRAAGEYHRYLYEQPQGPASTAARERLGWCYVHGRRWDQALAQFRQLPTDTLGLGRAYLGLGQRTAAESVFRGLQAERQLARMAAEEGRWAEALPAFQGTPAEAALQARLAYQPRWPALAVACAVVPGGGYLYAGRTQDALSAFSVTAGFGATAFYYFTRDPGNPIGYATGGLTAVFWAGSAFGAAREAQRANAEEDARALAAVEAEADRAEPAW
ncbi:MAG: Tetratricopeptide repeat protein [Cyanobacteria bacterium RYN_339]|nr:Tetratricopeptide repeat protein [Cyanobacteria bacterium RYN_339]